MSYRIKRGEKLQHAVRRIAVEQINRGLREIDDHTLDRQAVVHQLRKRCKKLRGLLAFVQTDLQASAAREHAAFRDAARQLSVVRDANASLATYHQLIEPLHAQIAGEPLRLIGQALTQQLRAVEEDELHARLADFRQQMTQARARVKHWKLAKKGCKSLPRGLHKTHARARDCLAIALDDPTSEALHELRKQLKAHWYHVRLLQNLWKPVFATYARQIREAAETLGNDHDLAVLRARLLILPLASPTESQLDAVVAALDRQRAHLQRRGLTLARYVLAESTQALGKRLEKYWSLWQAKKGDQPEWHVHR